MRYESINIYNIDVNSTLGYEFLLSFLSTNRKLLRNIRLNSLAHEVQYGQRLDHIANIYYKKPEYWSLIALLNDKINPWDTYPGEIILVCPSVDSILGLIKYWQTQENSIYFNV